jgi:hypothetical protein
LKRLTMLAFLLSNLPVFAQQASVPAIEYSSVPNVPQTLCPANSRYVNSANSFPCRSKGRRSELTEAFGASHLCFRSAEKRNFVGRGRQIRSKREKALQAADRQSRQEIQGTPRQSLVNGVTTMRGMIAVDDVIASLPKERQRKIAARRRLPLRRNGGRDRSEHPERSRGICVGMNVG